jgi:hypothetical protein
VRREEHIARMVQKKNEYRILVIKLERKRPLEDLDIDMRIILKGIARIKMGWLNSSGSE